jgi:hypothetical protein
MQQLEKLRDEWTLRHGEQGTSQKRKREGKDSDVEELLSIATRRAVHVSGAMLNSKWEELAGVRVSGPMLNSKSEVLAKKLGHNVF